MSLPEELGDGNLKLPPNIENYVRQVEHLSQKDRMSSEDKSQIAGCKLKIAVWACRVEGVPVTRYSVSEILGSETSFVFENGINDMFEIKWESKEDREALRKVAEKMHGNLAKATSKDAPGKAGSVNPYG